MIGNAFWITLVGMGGVFAFLLLLICGISILRLSLEKTKRISLDKIATAIAVAQSQEG